MLLLFTCSGGSLLGVMTTMTVKLHVKELNFQQQRGADEKEALLILPTEMSVQPLVPCSLQHPETDMKVHPAGGASAAFLIPPAAFAKAGLHVYYSALRLLLMQSTLQLAWLMDKGCRGEGMGVWCVFLLIVF